MFPPQNTTWAGTALLNGNAQDATAFGTVTSTTDLNGDGTTWDDKNTFTFQAGVGNNSGNDVFSVTIADASAYDLGVYDHAGTAGTDKDVVTTAANTVNLLDQTNAQTAIGLVDTAIATVSSERANLGAVSNRMSSTMANLDQIRVNLTASQGRIQDADFAAETSNLAKGQILQQAATAMLAQANASKQQVLTLIR